MNLDTYLYRAIRKYGKENFTIEILDEEYSNEKEIYWIDFYKSSTDSNLFCWTILIV